MHNVKPNFLRHSGWVNQNSFKDLTLNIIGCGAVGSNAAMQASKMGFTKFSLWDKDTVEDHNLPNQAFFPAHIGKQKVIALEEQLKLFNPLVTVETHTEFFETSTHKELIEGILLISTDSMKSRADIFDTFNLNSKILQVLDTRLGFDYAEIYCMDPENPRDTLRWQSTLKNDSEIPDGPCNLRLCTTLVSVIVGTAVHYMCVPRAEWRDNRIRRLPFETKVSLSDRLYVKTWYNQ